MLLSQNYFGFSFSDSKHPLPVQIDSVGWGKKTTTEYDLDGMNRKEMNRYLFQYTLSGSGMLIYEDEAYSLTEGRAMIVKIPSKHRYFFPGLSPEWEFFYIMLYGSEVELRFPEICNSIGQVPFLPRDLPLIQQLMHIYREATLRKIKDSFMAAGLGFQFLMELCRISRMKSQSSQVEQLIDRSMQIIRAHYAKIGGLDDISDEIGISKCHFVRKFTERTGMSPGKYLTKIRVERAVKLLLQTDHTISEIAVLVGFSNSNYFSKVFRQYVGAAPGEFRLGKAIMPGKDQRS